MGTAAIAIILLAVVISAARLALPFVSDYREQLQTWVGDYFESDITFEQLNIEWHRFSPRLVLENVRLGQQGNQSQQLQLSEVFISVDILESLTFKRLQIQDISLEGVELNIERFADGRISVQGVELTQQQSSVTATIPANGNLELLNTLFATDRIRLKKVSVHLVDHQTDLGALTIRLADLYIENVAASHTVFAKISLPNQLGDSLLVNAEFFGDPQKPADWAGQFYIKGTQLKIPAWLALLPEQIISVNQGDVSIEAWGEWDHFKVMSLQTKTNIDELELAHKSARQTWQLQSFFAHALWQQQVNGWSLDVDEMAFIAADKRWDPTGFSLRYQKGEEKQLSGDIKLLDIESIATLLQFSRPAIHSLFSSQTNKQLLQILRQKPAGEVRNLNFTVITKEAAPPQFSLQADFTRLGLRAIKKIPGFRGISGAIFVKDKQAYLSLDTRRGSVYIPSLFRGRWPVSKLEGMLKLDWRDDEIRLTSPHIDIQNHDVQASAKFDLLFPPGGLPELDVQAHFIRGDGSQVPRYLPVSIMAPALVEWLDDAIVSGDLIEGSLLLRGPAGSFPFRDRSGVFDIAFDVENTQFNYHPDWPGLTGVDAAVQFYNEGMAVTAHKGMIQQSNIQYANAEIADFGESLLTVNGSVQSQIPSLIEFVNESPLDEKIGAFFRQTEGAGLAQVDLKIDMPIREINQTQLKGMIKLDDGQLNIVPARLDITQINGDIAFTESSFSISGMQAQHAEEKVSIDAYPVINNGAQATNITVQTAINLGEKLQAYEVPIHPFLVGKSNWSIDLLFPNEPVAGDIGVVELLAKSDLAGVAINLPAPLKKSVDRPLLFTLAGPISSQDKSQWQFNLADRLQGIFELSHTADQIKLIRGHLQLGDTQPGSAIVLQLPAVSTVSIDGKIGDVDINEWTRLNDRLSSQVGEGELLAIDIDLHFDQVRSNWVHLSQGRAQLKSTTAGVFGTIQSDEITGYLQISKAASEQISINAKVDYINLSALIQRAGNDEADLSVEVDDIPNLNLQIKQLDWGKAHLNKLRFRSVTNDQTLTVQDASFQNDNIRFSASGQWTQTAVPEETLEDHSNLTLKLQSNNFGKGLAELGLPGILKDGKGEVASSLAWNSALLSPEFSGLSGKTTISLRDGTLTSIEPGPAKLVGLFALKALPKRLFLDFSDISAAGLPFELMTGNINIKDGVAETKNAQITGPVARVKLKGEVDLVAQTYDQKITALPNLGASLPIIGVLAGGVLTGALALVADTALKDMGLDIDQLGQIEYTLTGHWDKPVLTQIQRLDTETGEGAQ